MLNVTSGMVMFLFHLSTRDMRYSTESKKIWLMRDSMF